MARSAVIPAGVSTAFMAPVHDTGDLDRAAGFQGSGSPSACPTTPAAPCSWAPDAHRDLATQAHTDGLTRLADRAAFTMALEDHLDHPAAQPVLLLLDLDDPTTVNDAEAQTYDYASVLRKSARQEAVTP